MAPVLNDVFTSCWQKIGRADEHINALEVEVLAWRSTEPYVSSKKVDDHGRRHSVVINVKTKPNLDRWALMAGDAIHNLRSALDHLAYAAASHETKQSPPPGERKLQFLIVSDPLKFPAAAAFRLNPLSSRVQAAFERLQPYNRPHHDFPPLLGLLREYDDADKHRLLNVVLSQLAQAKFSFEVADRARPVVPSEITYRTSNVEDGMEIAWFVTDPPNRDLSYKYEFFILVSITHSTGRSGYKFTELVPMLRFLRGEVIFAVNEIGNEFL